MLCFLLPREQCRPGARLACVEQHHVGETLGLAAEQPSAPRVVTVDLHQAVATVADEVAIELGVEHALGQAAQVVADPDGEAQPGEPHTTTPPEKREKKKKKPVEKPPPNVKEVTVRRSLETHTPEKREKKKKNQTLPKDQPLKKKTLKNHHPVSKR